MLEFEPRFKPYRVRAEPNGPQHFITFPSALYIITKQKQMMGF